MIVQNIAADGQKTDVTFTVSRADMARTLKMLDEMRDAVPYDAVMPDPSVVKVSVIGVGMRAKCWRREGNVFKHSQMRE